MALRPGVTVIITKRGNLHYGETGRIASIDAKPGISYPIVVQFANNSRSRYKRTELREV